MRARWDVRLRFDMFDSRASYTKIDAVVLSGGCTPAVRASERSGALLLSRNYFGFRA
jgi:hypothetical protein